MLPTSQAQLLCGVDEAGRGPLAGAVVAACVVLDPRRPIGGLADSKQLAPARRAWLAGEIRRDALAWAVASASVEEIDRLNILQATLLAMRRALEAMPAEIVPARVLVDGLHCPPFRVRCEAVVRGDETVAAISAASILAKVARDLAMEALDEVHPEYGFAGHKGYATPAHLAALRRYGPCSEHRRGFAPVRELLGQSRLDL